ncbi:MAG: hypothetical protein RL757_2753 [Bacteroidota bacterium]
MKLSLSRLFQVVVVMLFACQTAFSAPDVAKGKELFINNCASCHNKNMKDKLTGPALAGVQSKWADDKALYAWIRNSQAMIAAGNKNAVAIWNEYKPTVMTAFPALSDDDIASLMLYIDKQTKGGDGTKASVVGTDKTGEGGGSNTLLYVLLAGFLGGLVWILTRVIGNLSKTAADKAGTIYEHKTWIDRLTSKGTIGVVTFALIVLGGYTTVNNAVALGRQQNYAPSQPIKFSHETHAGLNKIDCQYCHDAARRSKHGSIPGTNTCINCHAAIKVGSKYGTQELTKIYVSAGFDPDGGNYISNYQNMSDGEVKAFYTKWIAKNYRETRKLDSTISVSLDEKAFVADQWSEIESSLKAGYKTSVKGEIPWTRIHNLPDHVYFNHSQHVAVGKVACQKCHGEVEKMEVLKQYSTLSMGWCINCHRETEVKFKENDYYKSYNLLHDELKSGKREKVTVQDIGGLECQKCHY